MSLDVSQLSLAHRQDCEPDDFCSYAYVRWSGEAHGVIVFHYTEDLTAKFWVSPIWNMRQKGVALVDSSGRMVKNERKDR
jgi:hypothetical protein